MYTLAYVIISSEDSAGIVTVIYHISRIRNRSILMEFLETSDCTDESRKDETCLQFQMKINYPKT